MEFKTIKIEVSGRVEGTIWMPEVTGAKCVKIKYSRKQGPWTRQWAKGMSRKDVLLDALQYEAGDFRDLPRFTYLDFTITRQAKRGNTIVTRERTIVYHGYGDDVPAGYEDYLKQDEEVTDEAYYD